MERAIIIGSITFWTLLIMRVRVALGEVVPVVPFVRGLHLSPEHGALPLIPPGEESLGRRQRDLRPSNFSRPFPCGWVRSLEKLDGRVLNHRQDLGREKGPPGHQSPGYRLHQPLFLNPPDFPF